jgi:hypothetical protein
LGKSSSRKALTCEVLGGRLACSVLRASTHWDRSYSEDRKKE